MKIKKKPIGTKLRNVFWNHVYNTAPDTRKFPIMWFQLNTRKKGPINKHTTTYTFCEIMLQRTVGLLGLQNKMAEYIEASKTKYFQEVIVSCDVLKLLVLKAYPSIYTTPNFFIYLSRHLFSYSPCFNSFA